MKTVKNRRALLAAAFLAAVALPLASCSSSTAPGNGDTNAADGGKDPSSFIVMTANENAALERQLTVLAEGACAAENEALPLEHQKVAQADVVQKMTLLASQGALPTHTIAGTAMVKPDGDLGKAGMVADIEALLTEQGAWDQVLPAAASTVKNVYGGMVSMPYQYNIEGIWYNKQIFEEIGATEPQTWDELIDVSQKAKAAGYTPMSQAGQAGWPLTRILGMYIVRNAGPDALANIASGDASMTDPEYLAGAEALADFAGQGLFGEGFATRDNDAATNLFLTGKAAMAYDGSWLLSSINDEGRNEIGADNIGFMPFPEVAGGKGTIDQYSANAGAAMIVSAADAGPKVADWLGCIAENYGQQALQNEGVITGFKVNGEVTDLSSSTSEMVDRIGGLTGETVLWFEALFDPKSNSLASTNATMLTTGQMTPEQYMTELQASLEANR